VRNEEVLHRAKEEKCLLKYVIEVKVEARIEVMER
jgi:hypothetical protein